LDKAAAQRCFDAEPPGPNGLRVANYWLSLWRGDALPLRADFRPRDIADQLPSIGIFDVIPDKSVRCRLFGSHLTKGIGRDLTGEDWLAMTPEPLRATRLERYSIIARGAIGRGLRAGARESGEEQFSEEMMLPFAEVAPDGTRQVLIHIAWRQSAYDPTLTTMEHSGKLSVEFRLTPLLRAGTI
jgi:hypothetical protein